MPPFSAVLINTLRGELGLILDLLHLTRSSRSASSSHVTMSSTDNAKYFASSTELADLGAARFDHDTAAIGDKDYALNSYAPVTVHSGHAPRGLEAQAFAWNTFQYTTNERDEKEEKKGDLHEGQLHRQNRAAQGGPPAVMAHENRPASYGGGGGSRGGRAGRRGCRGGSGAGKRNGQLDALCAGRKPEGNVPPLAKGFAEELDKNLFWDEPIV